MIVVGFAPLGFCFKLGMHKFINLVKCKFFLLSSTTLLIFHKVLHECIFFLLSSINLLIVHKVLLECIFFLLSSITLY